MSRPSIVAALPAPADPVSTGAEKELAIHALHGIFTALDWIDDGFLDDKAYADQIRVARTHLITAGKMLCEQAAERF